jgi:hypothetical protein
MTTMHMLEAAEADIAYDVHGPLPTADGRAPLFMIGQPMDARGFSTLASHFPDRTVITHDLAASAEAPAATAGATIRPGSRRTTLLPDSAAAERAYAVVRQKARAMSQRVERLLADQERPALSPTLPEAPWRAARPL